MRRFLRPLCFLILAALVLASASCGSRTGLSLGEPASCPDSARGMYVLTEGASLDARGMLWRFDPSTATFASVVGIPCLPPIHLPTALAVDRAGNLLIAGISLDRQLLRVNAATGACQATGFSPDLTGFGMAFSTDGFGGDTLYVVQSSQLASLDTSTWVVTAIGSFDATSWNGSSASARFMTGTGAADLFATYPFAVPPRCTPLGRDWLTGSCTPSAFPTTTIGRVDKATGSVTDVWSLTMPPTIPPGPSGAGPLAPRPPLNVEAFAFWGGDFYFFVAPGSGTVVWRFRPSDGSTVQIAQTDSVVLAAGVSTCAPLQ